MEISERVHESSKEVNGERKEQTRNLMKQQFTFEQMSVFETQESVQYLTHLSQNQNIKKNTFTTTRDEVRKTCLLPTFHVFPQTRTIPLPSPLTHAGSSWHRNVTAPCASQSRMLQVTYCASARPNTAKHPPSYRNLARTLFCPPSRPTRIHPNHT